VLFGVACGPKSLDTPTAAKLIKEAPEFAAPVRKLAVLGELAESVDVGVAEGIWRYDSRDATTGRPKRSLTDKGKQYFSDPDGTLAIPAHRELVEVTAVNEDPSSSKHRTAEFKWRYPVPELVQRYTGLAGPYTAHADLSYDGNWKVTALSMPSKADLFLWTAELRNTVQALRSAEMEAETTRTLAIEPQKFVGPIDGKHYVVTVADVQVAIDVEVSRRVVGYIDFQGCKVEDGTGQVTLRVDGVRGSAVAVGPLSARVDFEKLCTAAKEARQTWAAHYPEVAARGPLSPEAP
jgi:hypothetical protein